MVEQQLPKLNTGVRFPSPAPAFRKSPFVLLDDARTIGGVTGAALCRSGRGIDRAERRRGRPAARTASRGTGKDGLHAAGFLSYDAGAALLPQLGPAAVGNTGLVWIIQRISAT